MGWKGAMRSFGAAMRAAEREAERDRRSKHKQRVAENSAEAVQALDDHVEELTTLHISFANAIDWHSMVRSPRPEIPELQSVHQALAEQKLREFRPRFLDKLAGGSEKRRLKLEDEYHRAQARDLAEFDDARATYDARIAEWESDNSLAKRLIEGEQAAIKEVISEMQTLTKEGKIGTQIWFAIGDGFVHAKPEVHTDEVVPRVRRKQLASGALSESQMPAAQFNALYQDYVASAALRVAGDLFNILPLQDVYVSCLSELLNTSTGRKEKLPILSVHFVRETFESLNLDQLDPSDAMKNFRHNMRFKRASGFESVPYIVAEP